MSAPVLTRDNGRAPPGRHLDRVAPESPVEHRVSDRAEATLECARSPDGNDALRAFDATSTVALSESPADPAAMQA
jgi:hypothetical protein